MKIEKLAALIRNVPDFPKKGIQFKDITTLLKDKRAFKAAMDAMCKQVKGKKIDRVVGIESRGFVFGSLIAYKLGVGFAPVRKKGKLPAKTTQITYALEYGKDVLEIHTDAIAKGMRVLVVDDLLATGGTAQATAKLIEKCGGTVAGFSFLIELDFLKGRKKLSSYNIFSLIHF